MGVGLDRRNLDVPVTPALHDLAGAEHNSDTLADLNAKVSDADLIDEADARIPIGDAGAFDGAALLAANLTDTRIPFADDEEKLVDDADFTYDIETKQLAVTGLGSSIKVNGLAGVGERNVHADANGKLIIET